MISFQKENNDLIIRIIDNGHGFQKEKPSNGFGLQLTKERVTLLNQTLNQQQINFSISRKEENTEAIFHLINWLI
jgi:glucose-6-phosphate-specific signal transduction histidine kinase